jgi:putative sterol carrier protein
LIGPGDEGVSRDPEAIEIMFDTIRRGAITDGVRPGTTIEWDFADAEPWHIVLDNGGSRALQGRASHADLRLRCRFEDWADVMAGREDPRRLMLRRRLRPKGSPRVLLALPRVFG